jgi:hypothetical protein
MAFELARPVPVCSADTSLSFPLDGQRVPRVAHKWHCRNKHLGEQNQPALRKTNPLAQAFTKTLLLPNAPDLG